MNTMDNEVEEDTMEITGPLKNGMPTLLEDDEAEDQQMDVSQRLLELDTTMSMVVEQDDKVLEEWTMDVGQEVEETTQLEGRSLTCHAMEWKLVEQQRGQDPLTRRARGPRKSGGSWTRRNGWS